MAATALFLLAMRQFEKLWDSPSRPEVSAPSRATLDSEGSIRPTCGETLLPTMQQLPVSACGIRIQTLPLSDLCMSWHREPHFAVHASMICDTLSAQHHVSAFSLVMQVTKAFPQTVDLPK